MEIEIVETEHWEEITDKKFPIATLFLPFFFSFLSI